MVITAFLRLIRVPILLLIAVIQYATRHFLIEPMLEINGFELIMSDFQFGLLVLSSVLIAAGGYAINDYFDAKVDRINKPKTVVLDRLIKRRVAMATHMIFTLAGLLVSAYVSYIVGLWQLSALFLFAAFSLWFYTTNLKHQPFAGNLLMAIMAAFVPFIVGLFEIPLQNRAHPEIIEQYGIYLFNVPAYWIVGYALLFGFLTLIREITKDIIDIRGDKAYGSRTIPLVMGVKKTKYLLIALYAVLLIGLGWAYYQYLSVHDLWVKLAFAVIVLTTLIQFPLIYIAKRKVQFWYSAQVNNAATMIVVISMYLIKHSIEAHFM